MLKSLAISNMINISAVSISSELLEILSEENYYIHSSFESGLNIKVGNILSFIGNKSDTLVPYGILLKEDDVDKLIESIDRDTCIFRWNQEEESLIGSNIRLQVKGSKKYSSYLNMSDFNLEKINLSMIKENIDLSLVTGFDFTIEELITKEREKIQVLKESFNWANKSAIENNLKGWIGRGRGLTPSGDDFLQGILYINHLCSMVSSEFLEAIENLIEQEYTTDISKNYFISALRGMFTEPLIELLKAVEAKNQFQVKKSIDNILKFGHTSGIDILAGVYVGTIALRK